MFIFNMTLQIHYHIAITSLLLFNIAENITNLNKRYIWFIKKMIIIFHDKNNMNLSFQTPTQCNIN